MYDICSICPYADEATDSTGHDYYQCFLDYNPDNHPEAQCSKKGDEDA